MRLFDDEIAQTIIARLSSDYPSEIRNLIPDEAHESTEAAIIEAASRTGIFSLSYPTSLSSGKARDPWISHIHDASLLCIKNMHRRG
jgi:hypothetical protein